MRKTEKKYWANGYSIRGKWFKQWAYSFLNIGIIVSNRKQFIHFYKLI